MGTKRILTKQLVLEHLQKGISIREISEASGSKIGAVRAHVTRLIKDGKWKSKSQNSVVDYNLLLDTFLKRIETNIQLEQELDNLKQYNNRLINQLAATRNELVIAQDEVRRKEEIQGRLRTITDKLNKEQHQVRQEVPA